LLRFFQGTDIPIKSSATFNSYKFKVLRCLPPVAFFFTPDSFFVYDSSMKIHEYNQMMSYLTRREPKKETAKSKPMPIIKYIDRMNRLYGSSEVDKYGNAPSATDRIQDPKFFQKKLKNVQKEPIKKAPETKKILAAKELKPTVLELLEIEDWLNTIDPNYWIEEEKPKTKPPEDKKSLYLKTGITKLI